MIDCRKCEHYYVTWDKDSPHGCRGMGFKSRQLPIIIVRNTSRGMDCLLFKKKEKCNYIK
ncbi:MAG: uracil-DNA glycosylase [Deltaproteobacteria bacterium]|nr:uracil-DNA glycosylase [Deltaproteobacteria bacterium]